MPAHAVPHDGGAAAGHLGVPIAALYYLSGMAASFRAKPWAQLSQDWGCAYCVTNAATSRLDAHHGRCCWFGSKNSKQLAGDDDAANARHEARGDCQRHQAHVLPQLQRPHHDLRGPACLSELLQSAYSRCPATNMLVSVVLLAGLAITQPDGSRRWTSFRQEASYPWSARVALST